MKRYKPLATTLRELRAQGSPVDLSVADEPPDIEVSLEGGLCESRIFDLPGGLAGYILDVTVSNHTRRTVYCSDLELRLPWQDYRFEWLPDPREVRNSNVYDFPNALGLFYDRKLVLNHWLLQNGALKQRPRSGLLLATGSPIPNNVRHGQVVDGMLALLDSNGNEHLSTVRLWAERAHGAAREVLGKSNLFEKAKVVQGFSQGEVGYQATGDSAEDEKD